MEDYLYYFFQTIESLDDIDFSLDYDECKYYIKASENLRDLLCNVKDYDNKPYYNFVITYKELYNRKDYSFSPFLPNCVLSKEEEIELFKKYKNGDEEAFKEIIINNIALVINFAKKANHDNEFYIHDLIGYGFIGLIYSVRSYDYKQGNKFSTYASSSIKKSIYVGKLELRRMVRLTYTGQQHYLSIYKFISEYMSLNNDMPSIQTISLEVNIKEEEIQNIFNISKTFKYVPSNDLSFFERSNGKNDEQVVKNWVSSILESNEFNQKDKGILFMKFVNKSSNSEIGAHYGVSRETIRKYIKDLLGRIEESDLSNNVRSLYPNTDKLKERDKEYNYKGEPKVQTDKIYKSLVR